MYETIFLGAYFLPPTEIPDSSSPLGFSPGMHGSELILRIHQTPFKARTHSENRLIRLLDFPKHRRSARGSRRRFSSAAARATNRYCRSCATKATAWMGVRWWLCRRWKDSKAERVWLAKEVTCCMLGRRARRAARFMASSSSRLSSSRPPFFARSRVIWLLSWASLGQCSGFFSSAYARQPYWISKAA